MKDRCGSGHLLSLEPAHCTHILVLGLIKCRAQGSACHHPTGTSGGEAATVGPSLLQAVYLGDHVELQLSLRHCFFQLQLIGHTIHFHSI